MGAGVFQHPACSGFLESVFPRLGAEVSLDACDVIELEGEWVGSWADGLEESAVDPHAEGAGFDAGKFRCFLSGDDHD